MSICPGITGANVGWVRGFDALVAVDRVSISDVYGFALSAGEALPRLQTHRTSNSRLPRIVASSPVEAQYIIKGTVAGFGSYTSGNIDCKEESIAICSFGSTAKEKA